jgi:hypothetical protein
LSVALQRARNGNCGSRFDEVSAAHRVLLSYPYQSIVL